jgi:hypothetical protein
MKTAGELSAVNVVAGRMQDVYKSIHAVRMTMMMKALAEVGSPVRVTLSQQPSLQKVECEGCEAVVLKRWRIALEMTGNSEVVEEMLAKALAIKMVAEPATWSADIENSLRKEPETKEDENPYAKIFPSDATDKRKEQRLSQEASQRPPLSEEEMRKMDEEEKVANIKAGARDAGSESDDELLDAVKERTGTLTAREKAKVKKLREEAKLQRAFDRQTREETRLKRVREEARKGMVLRGLMVCRSCVSKAVPANPGLAETLGVDLTGVANKDESCRGAFAEWVAAAHGMVGKAILPHIDETPQSRIADIFDRTDEERNLCGQAVILKDGRRGQIVTVAMSRNPSYDSRAAYFRQHGKKLSKGISECVMLSLPAAFGALKRAQDRGKVDCAPLEKPESSRDTTMGFRNKTGTTRVKLPHRRLCQGC